MVYGQRSLVSYGHRCSYRAFCLGPPQSQLCRANRCRQTATDRAVSGKKRAGSRRLAIARSEDGAVQGKRRRSIPWRQTHPTHGKRHGEIRDTRSAGRERFQRAYELRCALTVDCRGRRRGGVCWCGRPGGPKIAPSSRRHHLRSLSKLAARVSKPRCPGEDVNVAVSKLRELRIEVEGIERDEFVDDSWNPITVTTRR
jgi:hypothetical protein